MYMAPKPERNDVIHMAVKRGKVKDVQDVLDRLMKSMNHLSSDFQVEYLGALCDGKAPLHLAVQGGQVEIVEALLRVPNIDVNKRDVSGDTPLQMAVQGGHIQIVKALLGDPYVEVNVRGASNYTPLQMAVQGVDTEIVKALVGAPKIDVNVRDVSGETPLQKAVQGGHIDIVNALLGAPNIDVNLRDGSGVTPLHRAFADGIIAMLLEFSRFPEKINAALENGSGKSAIELAHEMGLVQMEDALTNTESGKRYMDNLYRDRQVYVDAANAILVGAALIASVTFAAWLQPPLNYTLSGESYSTVNPYPGNNYPKYADVEDSVGLGVFWIFNSLSFYFAIGTVVLGACSVLPRRKFFIKQSVVKLRRNLLWTSSLLALSVLFVLVAFGTAGVIVLMPVFKFRLYMIVPSTVGGLVCLISLGYLFYNILEESWSRKAKNGGDQGTSKEMVSGEKDGVSTEGDGSQKDGVSKKGDGGLQVQAVLQGP
ncbi:hypothetical protein M758_7G021200 [Ceratodon purpureus]|nr:hypothetical protein M758_7G021200 [Ceratodon purpureus]